MNTKTNHIIHWVLTGLIGFIFIGSALSKFFGGEEANQLAKNIGLTAESFQMIATLELLSVVLFIIPRTGMLGTLLLAAYMGGAIATHLTHGQSILAPAAIQAFIWITAILRFPELKTRLFQSKQNA